MKQGYNQKYGRSIPIIPSNYAIPNPANLVGTGSTSAVSPSLLIDTDADFIRQGVEVGATVYNFSTGLGAAVVTIIGESTLELSSDIFLGSLEIYAVGNVISGVGCAIWTGTGGNIVGTTIEGDFISLTNIPAGVILPIIFNTISSSTATSMVALFE
tara:strand:- start:45 stop:515 length:471 start_codon:yes stop_codon:yes gene_type:complete